MRRLATAGPPRELLEARCQPDWPRAVARLEVVSVEVAALLGDREAGTRISCKTALHIASCWPTVGDVDYQRFLELLVVKACRGPDIQSLLVHPAPSHKWRDAQGGRDTGAE